MRDESGGEGAKPDPVPPITREEMMLLRRAARQRWGIPDNVKTEVIARLYESLASPFERNRIMAARTLKELDRVDQQDERTDLDRRRLAQAPDQTDPNATALREFLEQGSAGTDSEGGERVRSDAPR